MSNRYFSKFIGGQIHPDFIIYSLTAVGITLTSTIYLPNTFYLDKYKELMQTTRYERPVPLDARLGNKFNECKTLLKLTTAQKKLISAFPCKGFNMFSAGSLRSKFGAIIGIPEYFSYKEKSDIILKKVDPSLIKSEANEEAIAKLENHLILTENEKKFAICSQILMTENYKMLIDSALPLVPIVLSYPLGQYINLRFDMFKRHILLRLGVYTIIGSLCALFYIKIKDLSQKYHECVSDKKLSRLDPQLIEAGITYYEKMISRNIMLRSLIENGSKKFDLNGESVCWYGRRPGLPLHMRKRFFQNKIKEMEQLNEFV